MQNIDKQLLEAYTPPILTTSEHSTATGFGLISKYLKSRQQIHVTQSEMDELANHPDFWFYASDAEVYKNLMSTNISSDEDFSNIDDGCGISEYVGVLERYLPSFAYLQYAKKNNIDILINIYDAYGLYDISRRHEILRAKVTGQSLARHNFVDYQKIPDYEFKVPELVKYTQFAERKYSRDTKIPCFPNPVHMLSVNIPYSYYGYQRLPVCSYNWDIDKKEHYFGHLNSTEFASLLEDICMNGIQKPLFMRMNGETLSAVNDETMVILLIAKLLKLPTIPVTIYLTNDDIGKNHLVDAMDHFSGTSSSLYKSLGPINQVLDPYIILIKPENDHHDQIATSAGVYSMDRYSAFSTSDIINVKYLNSDVESNSIYMTTGDTDLSHQQMKDDISESLNNDVEKMIQQLLGSAAPSNEDISGGN